MLHEIERVYIFPDDQELSIIKVRDVKVSESGGHRLTCDNKQLVYVRPGWLGIEIESTKGWEV